MPTRRRTAPSALAWLVAGILAAVVCGCGSSDGSRTADSERVLANGPAAAQMQEWYSGCKPVWDAGEVDKTGQACTKFGSEVVRFCQSLDPVLDSAAIPLQFGDDDDPPADTMTVSCGNSSGGHPDLVRELIVVLPSAATPHLGANDLACTNATTTPWASCTTSDDGKVAKGTSAEGGVVLTYSTDELHLWVFTTSNSADAVPASEQLFERSLAAFGAGHPDGSGSGTVAPPATTDASTPPTTAPTPPTAVPTTTSAAAPSSATTAGSGCPPADVLIAAAATGGVTATSADGIRCSGLWASAGLVVSGNEWGSLFKLEGSSWVYQPDRSACDTGEIPAPVNVVCMGG